MATNSIATANFRIHGTGWNGKKVDITVHASLEKSGAFQYGNGTCMVFQYEGRPDPDVYDTRYENVSPANFTEFALAELRARTMESLTVEVV